MLRWHDFLPKEENRAPEPVQMYLCWEKITCELFCLFMHGAGIHPYAGGFGQLTPTPSPSAMGFG